MKKYKNFEKMKLLSIGLIIFIWILSTSCMTLHHLGMGMSGHIQPHIMSLADPVCGMEVNSDVALSLNYGGNIFYFDSEDCLMLFQKNPEKFANKDMQTNKRNNRNRISAGCYNGWSSYSSYYSNDIHNDNY